MRLSDNMNTMEGVCVFEKDTHQTVKTIYSHRKSWKEEKLSHFISKTSLVFQF